LDISLEELHREKEIMQRPKASIGVGIRFNFRAELQPRGETTGRRDDAKANIARIHTA
jgi:hypothetical protein